MSLRMSLEELVIQFGAMSFGSDKWGKWVINEDQVELMHRESHAYYTERVAFRLYHFLRRPGTEESIRLTQQMSILMESRRRLSESLLNKYIHLLTSLIHYIL